MLTKEKLRGRKHRQVGRDLHAGLTSLQEEGEGRKVGEAVSTGSVVLGKFLQAAGESLGWSCPNPPDRSFSQHHSTPGVGWGVLEGEEGSMDTEAPVDPWGDSGTVSPLGFP